MKFTVEGFKDLIFMNDIDFKYLGKTYYIQQGTDSSIVGCYDDKYKESLIFDKYDDINDNFDDLLNNWHIQGKRLRDIINEIEIL